jgi:antitoxin MazE
VYTSKKLRETVMQTKVQKWGNSLGVRIPRAFAAQAQLHEGCAVDLSVEKGELRLKPTRKRYSMRELVRKIDSRNRHRETSTGSRVGREAW